jgi:hypothetical protein
MAKKSMLGSPRSTEKKGPGKVMGAARSVANGPGKGKGGMSVKPDKSGGGKGGKGRC